MVIFCSGIIGLKCAENLKNRAKTIGKIILTVDKIAQHIKLGIDHKETILKNTLPKGIFYKNKELRTNKNLGLDKGDKDLLKDFIEELGMGDAEGEIIRCAAYKSLFEKQLFLAEEARAQRYKITSLGGFFIGIILTILWW